MVITSPANPTIKRLALLRDRRGREREGRYLLEGIRLVEDALGAGAPLDTIVVEPASLQSTARGRALYDRLCHDHGLPTPLAVSPAVLRQLCDTDTPSGILASAPIGKAALASLPRAAGLALVLDGVQDPGNAGTILRTADAAAADGVVALPGCVDLFAPKVVRAAMGAHVRVPIAAQTTPAALVPWLAERGQTLLGDAGAGESVYDLDLRAPFCLVVGGEANGALLAASLPNVRRVRVPMPGAAESLNVAIAAAIIIFEALRQRGAGHGS